MGFCSFFFCHCSCVPFSMLFHECVPWFSIMIKDMFCDQIVQMHSASLEGLNWPSRVALLYFNWRKQTLTQIGMNHTTSAAWFGQQKLTFVTCLCPRKCVLHPFGYGPIQTVLPWEELAQADDTDDGCEYWHHHYHDYSLLRYHYTSLLLKDSWW